MPVFEPGPTILWGWVTWEQIEFRTSAFEGLNSFTCQYSKPWTPGAFEDEYLNAAIFPPDEAVLAALIGENRDNRVHAVRYSFVGDYPNLSYGRQWVFYFFPDGLTVVALHGAQDGQVTYEWIYDHLAGAYVWRAVDDFWDGGYFCFQGRDYIGDCVFLPPPPEEIFRDGFEP